MTELETKIEADEFTDELSDEALDRAEGVYALPSYRLAPVADR